MAIGKEIENTVIEIMKRNFGKILETHKKLGSSFLREIFVNAGLPIPPGVVTADSLVSTVRCGGIPDCWNTISTIFAGMIHEVYDVIPSLACDLDKGFGIVQDIYGPIDWR